VDSTITTGVRIKKRDQKTIERSNKEFWSWVLKYYNDNGKRKEVYLLPDEDVLLMGMNSGVLRKDGEEYALTERAIRFMWKLRAKEDVLRNGVSIDSRTWIVPPPKIFEDSVWYKYVHTKDIKCPSFLACKAIVVTGNALSIKSKELPRFITATTERIKVIDASMKKLNHDIVSDISITPRMYQRNGLDGVGVVWFYTDDNKHKFAMQERYYDLVSCYWPRKEVDAGYFVHIGDPSVIYCRLSRTSKIVFPGNIGMACGAFNVFEDNGWPKLQGVAV